MALPLLPGGVDELSMNGKKYKYGVPTGAPTTTNLESTELRALQPLYVYLDMDLSKDTDVSARVFLGKVTSMSWNEVHFFVNGTHTTKRVVTNVTTNMLVDALKNSMFCSLPTINAEYLQLTRTWTKNPRNEEVVDQNNYSWTSNINFEKNQNKVRKQKPPARQYPSTTLFPVFPIMPPTPFVVNFELSTDPTETAGFLSKVSDYSVSQNGPGISPESHWIKHVGDPPTLKRSLPPSEGAKSEAPPGVVYRPLPGKDDAKTVFRPLPGKDDAKIVFRSLPGRDNSSSEPTYRPLSNQPKSSSEPTFRPLSNKPKSSSDPEPTFRSL